MVEVPMKPSTNSYAYSSQKSGKRNPRQKDNAPQHGGWPKRDTPGPMVGPGKYMGGKSGGGSRSGMSHNPGMKKMGKKSGGPY